jgi:hypothetical protein
MVGTASLPLSLRYFTAAAQRQSWRGRRCSSSCLTRRWPMRRSAEVYTNIGATIMP